RTGIFFALDDDILYPANYVTRLRAALEQVDYQGVVGVHGVFYPAAPASFLNRKIIKYTESNRFLRPVSLLGTGTIAFAIDRIGVDLEVFETPGMADVWLAKYAKEHRIPMFAVSRPENWLRDAELPADSPTIWSATRRDHSLVSKVIYEQRPWGLPDLLERTDRLAAKGRLPERWRDFRAFCRDLQRYGAGRAVAALPPSARIWDYLKFFLEPAEALAVAEAALAEQGYDSLLFRRAVIAGANHDTQRAAEILAGALQAAAAEERWESAVWLACRASRLYRYVGDVERATAVLARVQHVETLDRTEDLGRLRSEQANAAISARDYPAACEILRASARLIPPTPDYHFRLAYALAKADSIRAAAPSIADLFLAAEAKQQQLNLIRLLRGFRYRNESLSGLPAGDRLERACAAGAIDPLPVIHLYLALGDREGAGRLLEVVRPRIADRRADYLPWLDAAVAPEIDLVIGHVNKALAAGGFAELVLGSARDAVTPLARLGTAALPSDRADDVSVIMTAYNCAETIGYAIESILNQTVGPLELIIVDDGSTDGTSEVVSDYAARDQRVIHLSSGRNAGPYVCRNLALAKARGQFIAIQDCDDYAHPQRLAHQLDLLARRDAMACYTGHVRVADEGQIVPENHGELIGEGPMTLMIRRRVVDDLGYFMPVRSRGDVEHRERMIAYYGSHRVLLDDAVLLFARDSKI